MMRDVPMRGARVLWRGLILAGTVPAFCAGSLAAEPEAASERHPPPASRTFDFTYGATIAGLPPAAKARIWVPVPPSNGEQDVEIVSRKLPVRGKMHREPAFGNRILYLEAEAGDDGAVPLSLEYRVTRREQKGDGEGDDEPATLDEFLKPNRLVPIDGRPLELIEGRPFPQDQLATARILYDVVERHMRYDKQGTGWGRGDAVWACENGYGNCTDFHSLFMSLARSRDIPVRFEIGFLLPGKRGRGEVAGYHCWAGFRPAGRGWIPVDISEAAKDRRMRDYYFGNLTEDRVTFSIGRDLVLSPRQDGEPLNFFVYPYVEVNGRPHPEDHIRCRFEWRDVEESSKCLSGKGDWDPDVVG